MEKSTFAHRVLLALGFGVIATIFLTAAYVGVLGPSAQVWLQAQLGPLVALYRSHREAFNLVIVVLGTGVPAVTGSLAILKAFYYAEMNLPARLEELVEAAKAHHLAERPELLAYVRGPFDTQDFLVPAIISNPFARLLHVFGFSTIRHRAREYASSVDIRAREVAALATKKEDVENRMITGRVLRGEYFSRLASSIGPGSPEWRANLERALAEYGAILACRGGDIEALEATAAIKEKLDCRPAEVIAVLNRIEIAARKQRRPLHRARALRRLAAYGAAKGDEAALDDARISLVTARDLLDDSHALSKTEQCELAEILLLYGEVQLKREKFSASQQALGRGRAIFAAADDEGGRRRADCALERLTEVSQDKEGPKPE